MYKDTVREHTFKRNREHYNNNIKPYKSSNNNSYKSIIFRTMAKQTT
ncbi:MAG: hypothetical protein ACNI3C_10415 [Candidatus Marinarcus sp.]